jgi:hypothetical protein
MFEVEIYGRVRRAVRVEGKSQRAVAREFHFGHLHLCVMFVVIRVHYEGVSQL